MYLLMSEVPRDVLALVRRGSSTAQRPRINWDAMIVAWYIQKVITGDEMLPTIQKKIEAWLSKVSVVVTSEPICSANKWLVIRGDLVNFDFEEFDSEQAAATTARSIQHVPDMGVGIMSLKVIVLTAAQVRGIHNINSYRETVRQSIIR